MHSAVNEESQEQVYAKTIQAELAHSEASHAHATIKSVQEASDNRPNHMHQLNQTDYDVGRLNEEVKIARFIELCLEQFVFSA